MARSARLLRVGAVAVGCAAGIVAISGAESASAPKASRGICKTGRYKGHPPWGYADLHAHPAAHLAFGSEALGDGGADVPQTSGLIWGSPGLSLGSDASADLPACNPGSHQPSDWPFPRDLLRGLIVKVEDAQTNLPHRAGGWPYFDGWPDSQSLPHQMMHVSWLHRAWQGGLRYLNADTVETEILALGFQQGFCNTTGCADAQGHLRGGELVRPIPGFDRESAQRQIDFIKALANANPDWMKVVTSADDALAAMCDDKLAVVLGVEMDELTLEQILELRDQGVRHVIPIHLADSQTFGGTAIYGDLFNGNTNFLTHHYFAVLDGGDDTIPFRLSEQVEHLKSGPFPGITNLELPAFLSHDDQYCALRYEDCRLDGGTAQVGGGQRNALGLVGDGGPMRELLRKGMLVDVAHMGDQATEGTLDLARQLGCPVMDSHTSFERASRDGRNSERDLKFEFAEALFDGGGMVGLGTSPYGDNLLVGHWAGSPAMVLSPAAPEFLDRLPSYPRQRSADVTGLRLRVWTAGAGLPSGSLELRLWTADGTMLGPLVLPRSGGAPPLVWELPACEINPNGGFCLPAARESQITGVGLTSAGRTKGTISGVTLSLVTSSPGGGQGEERPLLQRFGAPVLQLGSGQQWASSAFQRVEGGHAPITQLEVKVVTGAQPLPGGMNDNAVVEVSLKRPRQALAADQPTRKPHRRGKRRREHGHPFKFTSGVTGNVSIDPPLVFRTPLNGTQSLKAHSTRTVSIHLPQATALDDILSIDLATWFPADLFGFGSATTWDVDRVEVGDGRSTIAVRAGAPWTDLANGNPRASVYETYDDPYAGERSPRADHFLVTVSASDLAATEAAEAVFLVKACGEIHRPLNAGLAWGGGTHSVMVSIGCDANPHPSLDEVEAFGLRYGGGLSWTLDDVALELLSNPPSNWLRDYRALLGIAGDAGVAMGTDINGMAQQIAYSENPVLFPYHPGGNADFQIDGGCVTGCRVFDLSVNGVSHIGMIPDFLEAVRVLDGGAPAIERMYGSAAQAVDLWFKVEDCERRAAAK